MGISLLLAFAAGNATAANSIYMLAHNLPNPTYILNSQGNGNQTQNGKLFVLNSSAEKPDTSHANHKAPTLRKNKRNLSLFKHAHKKEPLS